MVAVLVTGLVRTRGLVFVAATLVTVAIVLIATGGSVDFARGVLVASLIYAMLALWHRQGEP